MTNQHNSAILLGSRIIASILGSSSQLPVPILERVLFYKQNHQVEILLGTFHLEAYAFNSNGPIALCAFIGTNDVLILIADPTYAQLLHQTCNASVKAL
jgi:hypothetical protein